MKFSLLLVVSHLVAIGLGFLFAPTQAIEGDARAPNETSVTSLPRKLSFAATVEGERVQSEENFSAQDFERAFARLAEGEFTAAERQKVRLRLFTEWAQVDLRAAMTAILGEPWSEVGEGPFLGKAFGEAFRENPEMSWEILQSGEFGTSASRFRKEWYEIVAREHPEFLVGRLPELSWRDREILLRSLVVGGVPEGALEALLKMPSELVPVERIFQVSPLPSMAQSAQVVLNLTDFKSRESQLALMNYGANLKEEMSKLPADAPEVLDFPEKVARLPSEVQGEFLYGMLHDFNTDSRPGRRAGLDKTTYLLDQLVAGEHWEYLGKPENLGQFRGGTEDMTDVDRAAWATELPVREETRRIFQAGVNDYIGNNLDLAWDWIQEFPADHWRSEALAIYERKARSAGRAEDANRAAEARASLGQ